jgi:hypothetical protein
MLEQQAYEHNRGQCRQRIPVYSQRNFRNRKVRTYQVATYEACAFRMSTMGTLPIGTPLDMRMAASPA